MKMRVISRGRMPRAWSWLTASCSSERGHGGEDTIKAVRKSAGVLKKIKGIAGIKQHGSKMGMFEQGKHGRKMNVMPLAAANGEMLGTGAVTGVKYGNPDLTQGCFSFHQWINS